MSCDDLVTQSDPRRGEVGTKPDAVTHCAQRAAAQSPGWRYASRYLVAGRRRSLLRLAMQEAIRAADAGSPAGAEQDAFKVLHDTMCTNL